MKKQFYLLFIALSSFSSYAFAQAQSAKEMILHDNLNFGTSKADYYKQIRNPRVEINGYEYTFHPQFYKDSVITSLTITTDTLSAESFKTVEKAMYNLSDHFTKEYGKPPLYNKTIAQDKVVKGRFVILTFWQLRNKYIVISLFRTSSDKYYATCKIENKAYEKWLAEAGSQKATE